MGNYGTPDEAFTKDCFKLLIDRSLGIEENEDTSNVEKKSSHSEVFSWTYPVKGKPYGRFSEGEIKPRGI